MRRIIPSLALLALVGCGGGGLSGSERQTLETIRRTPMDKATSDSMRFSDWDSTTVEEGGKTWKVVRVKTTHKPGGTGAEVHKDILFRYSGEPTLDQIQ